MDGIVNILSCSLFVFYLRLLLNQWTDLRSREIVIKTYLPKSVLPGHSRMNSHHRAPLWLPVLCSTVKEKTKWQKIKCSNQRLFQMDIHSIVIRNNFLKLPLSASGGLFDRMSAFNNLWTLTYLIYARFNWSLIKPEQDHRASNNSKWVLRSLWMFSHPHK